MFKATEEIRAAQVSVKMEHSLERVGSAVNMPDKPNCVAVSVKDRLAMDECRESKSSTPA